MIGKMIKTGLESTMNAFVEEMKTIFTDGGAILLLIVAVTIYPVVYSIAYKNNVVRDIPVAVVDLDRSQLSRQMSRMLDATKEVAVHTETGNMEEAQKLFWDGTARGIILIPSDFEKGLLKGEQSDISVYCDASYFLIYKETLTGLIQSSGTLSAGVEIKRLIASGALPDAAMQQRDPMKLNIYQLYNPSGAYGSYVMPGLILIVIQQTLLIGIGMIGGARKERGDSVIAGDPARRRKTIFPIILGKAFAYFVIYVFNVLFTQIIIYKWFGFPDKGSIADTAILMVPYIFSIIFLGLSISLLLRRREHSIMLMVFLSPVVLFLSGMSWPENAIPPLLYKIAHIFPSTTMVPAFLRLRTMGASLSDIRPELIFLLVQMVVYAALAVMSYRIYIRRRSN
ncbi:MAG TPA: ABC transporter permease [Prolixibacteraceae bacterium]|nr:ABC transporter permease [Prolixibacteraceae bacterium]